MGVEVTNGRERIVCDGCGRTTIWYDAKQLRTEDVMKYNDIESIEHPETKQKVYACAGCRAKVEHAISVVSGAVQAVEMVIEGPPAEPLVPMPAPPVGASATPEATTGAIEPWNGHGCPPEEKPTTARPLVGVVFCLTGALSVTREEFAEMITDLGGAHQKSAKTANYAVVGDTGSHNVTKKWQEAIDNDVEIISEDDFWDQVTERRRVIDAEWEVVPDAEVDSNLFDVKRLPAPIDTEEMTSAFDEADDMFERLEKKLV